MILVRIRSSARKGGLQPEKIRVRRTKVKDKPEESEERGLLTSNDDIGRNLYNKPNQEYCVVDRLGPNTNRGYSFAVRVMRSRIKNCIVDDCLRGEGTHT